MGFCSCHNIDGRFPYDIYPEEGDGEALILENVPASGRSGWCCMAVHCVVLAVSEAGLRCETFMQKWIRGGHQ